MKDVAVSVPNLTLVTVENPVPVMVTVLPPASGPVRDSEVIDGPEVYVNGLAPVVPPGVVTVTVTVPAPWAGDFTVRVVVPVTCTVVPWFPAPNVTVAPVRNPVPVSVTTVPPAGLPPAGVTLVSVGTGS